MKKYIFLSIMLSYCLIIQATMISKSTLFPTEINKSANSFIDLEALNGWRVGVAVESLTDYFCIYLVHNNILNLLTSHKNQKQTMDLTSKGCSNSSELKLKREDKSFVEYLSSIYSNSFSIQYGCFGF